MVRITMSNGTACVANFGNVGSLQQLSCPWEECEVRYDLEDLEVYVCT